MSVYLWLVVGYLIVALLVTVGSIGEPREPLSASTAAVSVVVSLLLVLSILLGGHVL